MKKIIWLAVAAVLFFTASCKKNVQPKTHLSGTYTGTFLRVGMVYQGPDSVKINFTQNGFDGATPEDHYPDICHGTYEISGDSVDFQNQCVFTANFDFTLILSGKYRIYISRDSLNISRKYTGTAVYSDTYALKKQ